MKNEPIFQQFGDYGLLISWPAKIDPLINDQVLNFMSFILSNYQKEVIEIVPAYHSLAVYLKEGVAVINFTEKIRNACLPNPNSASNTKNIITVPVCYNLKFAPDILEIANTLNISVNDVVEMHTAPLYKVYFLGFLPGFPYLGGLDEKLFFPRKSKPRRYVERGAVAIGGSQTGIYTIDSPGGWNIIGKSPLSFFSINETLSCLLKPGDCLKFKPISLKEYKKIDKEIQLGDYSVEKEVGYD